MGGFQQNDDDMISGINVTPLVDITLVLLIIFMVTATYIAEQSIKIELPKAKNGEDSGTSQLSLVVDKDGGLYLNGAKTTQAEIAKWIKEQGEPRDKLQVIVSADRRASHGDVVGLIDFVKGLGVTQFAINTKSDIEIETEEPPPASQEDDNSKSSTREIL